VVGVAVADGGEVEARDILPLQNREVGVVGKPLVDFDGI
jgi:hypothetical protein